MNEDRRNWNLFSRKGSQNWRHRVSMNIGGQKPTPIGMKMNKLDNTNWRLVQGLHWRDVGTKVGKNKRLRGILVACTKCENPATQRTFLEEGAKVPRDCGCGNSKLRSRTPHQHQGDRDKIVADLQAFSKAGGKVRDLRVDPFTPEEQTARREALRRLAEAQKAKAQEEQEV